MDSFLLQLYPAASLEDVYKTLSPSPLIKKGELDAFYRGEVNQIRGDDKVVHLKLGLKQSFNELHYKALLIGHGGVGKSTELSRLVTEIKSYQVIRFSAYNDLDSVNFQPFDVLLLMMILLMEQVAKPVEEGGANFIPSPKNIADLWDWYGVSKETRTEFRNIAAEASAGAGPSADSWWGKALGIFGGIKGEVKFASDRKRETTVYDFRRDSDLIAIANSILFECNEALKNACGKQWLFIGEDFEKPGVSPKRVEEFFIQNANIIKNLQSHMIFTIPITLVYSQKRPLLPFSTDKTHCIYDTPVFQQNHKPHEAGRTALRTVLEARVNPSLFDSGQMERLLVASGGNFRDLFSLVLGAAENAIIHEHESITEEDVTKAINKQRWEYLRSLGTSPHDEETVQYKDKAERLMKIYYNEPESDVPDAVLHSLLMARAVQEFNGKGWFGVHPLVVDILKNQKRFKGKGRVLGGTE